MKKEFGDDYSFKSGCRIPPPPLSVDKTKKSFMQINLNHKKNTLHISKLCTGFGSKPSILWGTCQVCGKDVLLCIGGTAFRPSLYNKYIKSQIILLRIRFLTRSSWVTQLIQVILALLLYSYCDFFFFKNLVPKERFCHVGCIHTQNKKRFITHNSEVKRKVKVLKFGSNSQAKVTWSNIILPM